MPKLDVTLFSSAFFFSVAESVPIHARQAKIVSRQDELLAEYDYIIVGAGTAGLTLADRLTETDTVLAIEYGYLDSSESIVALTLPDIQGAARDEYPAATRRYNISTVPQVELNNRRGSIRAGAAVGGSSAVNGMLLDRGSTEDFDSWITAMGEYGDDFAAEWGWENLLPWFKKSVTFHPPTERMVKEYGVTSDVDAAYGGTSGIHSSYRPYQWPTQQRMFNALREIPGIGSPTEGADGSKYGAVWCPNSIDPRTEQRSYAKTGHYDSEPSTRENFHILPAHRVIEVVMAPEDESNDTWIARGVRYTPRDGRRTISQVSAAKEVIVAAGTIHTPQVLERSGIGSQDVLKAADVKVKVDLPGVGWNYQSHTSFTVSYRFRRSISPLQGDLSSNRTFAAEARRQWDEDKTGPYTSYVNSGVFLPFPVLSNNTEQIIARLEAQEPTDFLPKGLDATLIAGYILQKEVLINQLRSHKSAWLESLFDGGSSFNAILLHLFSRGSIHISPNDNGIDTAPEVDYGTFTNPIDLDLQLELLRGIRWYMGHEIMVDALDPVEVSPGLSSDDEFLRWIRRTINADVAHQTGTASLGPKELGGVVGPDLRVYGTKRLSVADNSIIPLVPGSHTSAVAYAIGEKAADLVLRRAQSTK